MNAPQYETAIEPDLPIVDAHHHVRDTQEGRYLFAELLADLSSGHNIVSTVVIECVDMYAADGPPELRSVGETEFFNGIAAMFASGKYGRRRACAGIVGAANLLLGKAVTTTLDAHLAAAPKRFRGIRVSAHWHQSYVPAPIKAKQAAVGVSLKPLLPDPAFREGVSCLAPRNLSLDISVYHTQIHDLIDLARAFPDTQIVAGHFVIPLGWGPFSGKQKEVFELWCKGIRELARCQNVSVKMSGLRWARVHVPGYIEGEDGGFTSEPKSSELATAWHPYIDACVEAFGPHRCMFASNYPPEKVLCGYVTLWNAFKRATVGYSGDERAALFSQTAVRLYRLPTPT